jgi:hypothetical protein
MSASGSDQLILVRGRGFATHSQAFDSEFREPLALVVQPERRITGRVLASNGKPVDRVLVFALDPAVPLEKAQELDILEGIPTRWIEMSSTASGGRFELRGVPEGEIHLAAKVPVLRGDSSIRIQESSYFVIGKVARDAKEITLTLPTSFAWPRGDVRFELKLADSRLPSRQQLECSLRSGTGKKLLDGFRQGLMTGPRRIEFFDVPAGRHNASGSAGDYGHFRGSVGVSEDGIARVIPIVLDEN